MSDLASPIIETTVIVVPALTERRAEAIFDVLVEQSDGVSTRDLQQMLVDRGLLDPELRNRDRVVRGSVIYLRKLLAAGDGWPDVAEVVPYERNPQGQGLGGRYRIADSGDMAMNYRRHRAAAITVQLETIRRQLVTERTKFGGAAIFTNAAVDFLDYSVRELRRASEARDSEREVVTPA